MKKTLHAFGIVSLLLFTGCLLLLATPLLAQEIAAEEQARLNALLLERLDDGMARQP